MGVVFGLTHARIISDEPQYDPAVNSKYDSVTSHGISCIKWLACITTFSLTHDPEFISVQMKRMGAVVI